MDYVNKKYDVIIVGGGIVGIGLLRDLSLHGLSCLLLEKGDFSSQTSQNSSKMLHGGIRYLENMDFLLVREALYEKNFWIKHTPHLAKEVPFCLPVYKESKYPLFMTSIGLKVYDFLSGFKNKTHSTLGKKNTLKLIPNLKKEGLKGSGIYYDAIVDDHKLALECLYDALLDGKAVAYNYHEVQKIDKENPHLIKVYSKDTLTGEEKEFIGRDLIFATGPFTDQLLKEKLGLPWEPQLLLSKGSHIWINPEVLPLSHPIVLQTKDKRIIFVIPQSRGILVGTTETQVTEEIFNIKASEEDIDYLLKNLNEYFPDAHIEKKHILSSFSGVRPLVRQAAKGPNAHKTSRNHKIFEITPHIHVIAGGKYTTFRVMGKKLTTKILKKHKMEYRKELSLSPLRQTSVISTYKESCLTPEKVERILRHEYPRTIEDLIIRRIGIPSKSHWKEDIPFYDFWEGLFPILSKRLPHLNLKRENFRNKLMEIFP